MDNRSQEYNWYLVGSNRLGHDPITPAEFSALWQQYEDHAEMLKLAETEGRLAELDAPARLAMERKIQLDPILKAVLIGQSEDNAGN